MTANQPLVSLSSMRRWPGISVRIGTPSVSSVAFRSCISFHPVWRIGGDHAWRARSASIHRWLFGVISYGVSQRTREIGIRLALGASGATVMRGALRQGVVLTGVGLGIGLAIAAASTRIMTSILFGVSATDWQTFAVAALVLGIVATLSAYLPARRAARLDPLAALRAD